MKIYIDSCCYGRPFDDQTQEIIRAESSAVQNITMLSEWYGYTVFGSPALDADIMAIKNINAKKFADVWQFYQKTITERAKMKEQVLNYYEPLAINANIRGSDVFHLCFSVSMAADFLVTTDKKFVRAAKRMALPVTVINPKNFPLGGAL